MFDISTRLVSEQDEISGLETIGWGNHSWKYLSLIGDERVINLQRRKVYVFFGFCVMPWEDFRKSWIQRCMGAKIRMDKIFTESMESRMSSSRTFFQDSIRCSSAKKSKVYCTEYEKHWKFHRKNSIMSMFNDFSCGTKGNATESVVGPGSEKKWSSISEGSPQGICDRIAERTLLEFAESGCPFSVRRLHFPEVNLAVDQETIETTLRIIISANHLSLLWSSRRDVWRVWIPSREKGATRCDGTIKFFTRAQCDQERSSLWILMTQRIKFSFPTILRTNWEAVTTR